jgi:hypothetical protein
VEERDDAERTLGLLNRRLEQQAAGHTSANPRSKPLDVSRLGGAEGQNRTADTVIFSHVLYQLSYLGTVGRV